MEIVDKYIDDLYIIEDINYLLEFKFKSLLDKFKKDSDAISFGKKLKTSVDPKNPGKTMDKIKSLTKHIKIDLSSIDKVLTKADKDFTKRKNLAQQILKNSLSKASSKSIDMASTLLSFSSIIQKKNDQVPVNQKLKTDIQQFVSQVRKFQGEYEGDESETPKKGQIQIDSVPDYAIGIAVILTSVFLIWGLTNFTTIMITGVFVAVGSFLSFLVTPLGLALILIFGIMTVVFKNQADSY